MQLTLENARLVQSNLGGQDGPCANSGVCDEPPPVVSTAENSHILVRDIFLQSPQLEGTGRYLSTESFWMRITNDTEYRAWNTRSNGIRRVTTTTTSGGTSVAAFMSINLLGPRLPTMRPLDKYWNERYTLAQFRVTIMSERGSYASQGLAALAPRVFEQLFFVIYDIDAGRDATTGELTGIESMQFEPGASLMTGGSSELSVYDSWIAMLRARNPNGNEVLWHEQPHIHNREVWDAPVYSASSYGVGADNPAATYRNLTPLQHSRAVRVQLDNAASFRVKFSIAVCCTTVCQGV